MESSALPSPYSILASPRMTGPLGEWDLDLSQIFGGLPMISERTPEKGRSIAGDTAPAQIDSVRNQWKIAKKFSHKT